MEFFVKSCSKIASGIIEYISQPISHKRKAFKNGRHLQLVLLKWPFIFASKMWHGFFLPWTIYVFITTQYILLGYSVLEQNTVHNSTMCYYEICFPVTYSYYLHSPDISDSLYNYHSLSLLQYCNIEIL